MIHKPKGLFDIRNIYSGLKSLILRHRIISRYTAQILVLLVCAETFNTVGGRIFQGEYLLFLLGVFIVAPTYHMACEIIDHKLLGTTIERGTWLKLILSNMFGIGIVGLLLLNPSNDVLVRLFLHGIANISMALYCVREGKHKVR